MPAIVVIGGQWGDEGKGRIIDLLAEKVDVVARYSAGNNAGHTVINEMGEFALHLVPAGIFYPGKTCLMGNGLVVDPAALLGEIESLESRAIHVRGRLFLSDRAHVLMPWHRIIDNLDEKLRGEGAIGTTGRGVGPAFMDKVGRAGLRVADLIDPDGLLETLRFLVPYKNAVLQKLYGAEPLRLEDVYQEYLEYGSRLAPFVTDTSLVAQEALRRGETILMEGAQGALLDVDSGTYAYVTSSVPSSLAAGAAIGVGIGPSQIEQVLGVYKAYNTRVGNGPMPTELLDDTGVMLREGGPRPEYGATTGRPRRCGWFDAVAARYSARINGLTAAALTRLDVLDKLPVIKVCAAYRIDGQIVKSMPATARSLNRAECVYEEFPGWEQDTSDARQFDDLPENARNYVRYIEEILETPISLVSIGPEREQAIKIRPII